MRALWENPLLRYHLLGATRHRWQRQPWLYGTATLGIGLVYLLVLQLTVFNEASIYATLGLALFVMCIAAPLMAYSLFSSEYEKQTWESLALTRLTAREIFWGKYGAALTRVALTTLLFAPFILGTPRTNSYVTAASFATLFGWGTLLVSVSLWLSFKLKRTLNTAATLYAGQVFVLWLLPMLYTTALSLNHLSDYILRDLISSVQSYTDAFGTWIFALFNGAFIVYANPFFVATELERMGELTPYWWDTQHDWTPYQEGLYFMLWGFVQSIFYLGLALLLAGLTYRGIKISWRK